MTRQLLPFACLCLVLSLGAGCAGVPTRPAAVVPSDLAQLQRWHAHGRLGVSGPAGGGSASFDWQQRGDRTDLQLRGPVGIGSVLLQLRGDPLDPELKLQTSDGLKLESQAAWGELEARLGAPVPAGSLRYWMLGLAAPGEHRWIAEGDTGGATLEQAGWRIAYQRYSSDSGARVPVKMSATSGDARVRIVVDRWQLGQ